MWSLLLVVALAQGPAPEVRAQARRLFEQGEARFAARDYPAAEEAFSQSYATLPLGATAWNLARTSESLGRLAAAIGWYRRSLGASPTAADRAEVEQAIGRLEKKLAARGVQALTLLLAPPHARAAVDDGLSVESGATLELPAGRHGVLVSAEGYVPVRLEVELRLAASQGVSVTLTEVPAPTGEHGFAELPPPPDAPVVLPEPGPAVVEPAPRPPPVVVAYPTPSVPRPSTPPPGPRLRFAWVGVGLTAAALLTGAVAGTVAAGASGSLRDGTARPRTEADALVETTTTGAAVANGAWVAAGVLAVVSGVTMVIEW